MNRSALALAAALLCGTTLVNAADTPAAAGSAASSDQMARAGHRHRFDCSKAQDPAKCEEKRQAMRARFDEAKKTCEGKQGDERRGCMREAMCAKAADPAQCNERAQARAQRRQAAMAACKDKQGDDKRACLREQRRAHAPAAPATQAAPAAK